MDSKIFVTRAKVISIYPLNNGKGDFATLESLDGLYIHCNPFDTKKYNLRYGDYFDVVVTQRPINSRQKKGSKKLRYPTEGRTVTTVLKHITTDIATTPLTKFGLGLSGQKTENDLDVTLQSNITALPSFITEPSRPDRDWMGETMKALMTVRCLRTDDVVFKVTNCRKHYSDLTEGEKEQYHAVTKALAQLHKAGEIVRIAMYRSGEQSNASHVYWGRNLDDTLQVLDPNYDNRKKHERLAAYGAVSKQMEAKP